MNESDGFDYIYRIDILLKQTKLALEKYTFKQKQAQATN